MITFEERVIKTAEILKILGHPVRLKILSLLADNISRKLTVTQIQEILRLTQPETSKHLTLMKAQSILNCEKRGGNSYYSINDEYPFIRCVINQIQK